MVGEVFLSAVIVSGAIYIGLDKVSRSLRGETIEDVKRTVLGKAKQAEIIKKEDPLDMLLKEDE